MANTIFTYSEACQTLEAVREKTLAASERLETLRAQAEEAGQAQAQQLAALMDGVVQQWSSEILDLGALPKGVFTVDFDSGKGFFYCWSLNEPTLDHFHPYDQGFAHRKPLPPEEKQDAPRYLN